MNLRVSESLKSDLEAIANANDKKLIDVAIDALSAYVKKHNKGAIADQLLELQQEFPTLEQFNRKEIAL